MTTTETAALFAAASETLRAALWSVRCAQLAGNSEVKTEAVAFARYAAREHARLAQVVLAEELL